MVGDTREIMPAARSAAALFQYGRIRQCTTGTTTGTPGQRLRRL
jgi:hypothetical protein